MNICVFCEEWIDSDAVFCPFCGAKITYAQTNNRFQAPRVSNQQYNASPPVRPNYPPSYNSFQYNMPNYRLKDRTTGLTIVLVLNFLAIAILGFASFVLFMLSPPLGLIVMGLVGLYFWLIYELQQLNNTARGIYLALSILGLLLNLFSLNIIGLTLTIFEIYILAFHQPTIDLFNDPYTDTIYPSNNYYNYNNFNRNY